MGEITYAEATPADHAAIQACIVTIFEETAGRKLPEFSADLWRWQYVDGALGSVVTLARDGDQVCGYFHSILLPMFDGAERRVGAMVQDVGTLASHRGRGVFKHMGAHALASLRGRGVDFVYTFPNPRSLPSFVRNHGYTVVERVPVYIAPLDLAKAAAARLPSALLSRVITAPVGPAWRLLFARRARLQAGESVVAGGPFVELAPCFANPAGPPRFRLDRSADYLAWRYGAKPGDAYTVWTLRGADGPRAVLVTRRAQMFGVECLILVDFGCAPGEDAALARLVAARLAAERKAGAALAVTMALHPAAPALRRQGLVRVPERFNPRPFNLVVKDLSGRAGDAVLRGPDWQITLGDWDVY